MAFKSNLKLSLLLVVAALLHTSAGADLFLTYRVCGKHTDGRFCVTQLRNTSFSDISGLANISIDLTKSRATHTTYIKALIGNENNTHAKAVLEDCLALYNSAAEAIEDSRASFEAKDYWKMNNDASTASTYAGTCEAGFVEANLASPLSRHIKALQNFAQIVEIVANVLAGKA